MSFQCTVHRAPNEADMYIYKYKNHFTNFKRRGMGTTKLISKSECKKKLP